MTIWRNIFCAIHETDQFEVIRSVIVCGATIVRALIQSHLHLAHGHLCHIKRLVGVRGGNYTRKSVPCFGFRFGGWVSVNVF